MPKLKSHKTVEQIAKKHRLDVSFIQKQLDMGEPIEHEHTKDHKLARDIALQHLDEIPDYYTRLKKMEASAKKNHKKFKDVKEETKSGDESLRDWFKKSSGTDPKTGRKVKGWVQLGGPFAGAPCARQPGQTSTPKCGSSKMAANLSPEEEEKAFRRKNRNDPNQPEKKNASKPTNVRTEEMDLQEKKKSGKKDACYNKVKSRYDVWPSAYASGALVKCRKVGAANWGTKSEETMHEEERYCPLCDKRETRSECSYGEKVWDKISIKDEEYSMARSELKTIEDAVKRLKAKVGKGEGDLEAWVQSKITKAADYIDTAADYISSGEMEEGISFEVNPKDIRKSKRSTSIRNLSQQGATEGEREAAQSKRKEPRMPLVRPGDTNIRNINAEYEPSIVDKILSELGESGPCWKGYKRKKGTSKFEKGSCVKSENVSIEDANGNTFAEVIDIIKPEPIKGFKSQVNEAIRMQAQTGNVIGVTLNWRGKYYSLKMFFPQVKLPTRKEINDELQKVYPGSIVVYHSVSEIQPGKPLIQTFSPQGGSSAKLGPSKNYVKPMGMMGEEVEVDEDWQKVNRQDRTDGLSPAAVKAYRRENPGSKLQTAVTEKNPTGKRSDRRKSFCRRMSGMKSKLTSTKTARDPDSRINKALRRWNCN
jgi:hypothetical protein